MNVLITGGAGFIGSLLAQSLTAEGAQVKVLDNLSTGRIENLNAVREQENFSFVRGSVTERADLEPLAEWADHVYHLAAPVGVKYIMKKPVLTIVENIRAIDLLLELAHKYAFRALIASTSEVYGRNLDLLDPSGLRRLRETDYRVEGPTTNHRWAYANTKALDEFLSLAYYKTYGTPVVIVRLFNVVGPRQLAQYGMVLPNFIQAALRNEDLTVYGDGEQKRSFLHVSDASRAIIGLMKLEAATGEIFNLGNPDEISINHLAEKIITLTGSKGRIVRIPYEEAYGKGFEDMFRRTPDISKIKSYLDFRLEYDLEGILLDCINFFKSSSASPAAD